MRLIKRGGAACLLVTSIVVIAACGSSSNSSNAGGPNTIDVYSSLPLKGAVSAQTLPTVNGIKLALSQTGGKAGQWTVNYTSLDDSTAAAGKADDATVGQNARKAVSDPTTIAYLGEYNSGATKISLPTPDKSGKVGKLGRCSGKS